MKTLINLESPYAGDIELNVLYARFCMHDSLVNHDEAPFASHLLYTQPHVLRDEIQEERMHGIDAGREFASMTAKSVFYTDLGWSRGMTYALEHANAIGHEVVERTLPQDLWGAFLEECRKMGCIFHPDTKTFGKMVPTDHVRLEA